MVSVITLWKISALAKPLAKMVIFFQYIIYLFQYLKVIL